MLLLNNMENFIAENRAGIIVYLVILLLSHLAFGIFSTKHRFKLYIVLIIYALFGVFCGLMARYFHNFSILFITIFLVFIALYVLTSAGNPFKSMFYITFYLTFLSIFFGFSFMMLSIEGTLGIVLRWVFVVLFYSAFESFLYLYILPNFNKVQIANKQWLVLFAGEFVYLIIMFMQVFYPFNVSVENAGSIALFIVTVLFYMFVFIIILHSFATSNLYNNEMQKNGRLQEFATRDALTTLYNKNYLEIYKNKYIESKDSGIDQNIIVCIMDIDDFKSINDNYGHVRGDEVLREVATSIKEIFKEDCYKNFRFGGDEFIVIGEDINIEDIKAKVTELKDDLKTKLDISISTGCRKISHKDIDPIETAIKNADKQLYLEKFERKSHN